MSFPGFRTDRQNRANVRNMIIFNGKSGSGPRQAKMYPTLSFPGGEALEAVVGGVLVGLAQRVVIEQELAPDVGTDQREVVPGQMQLFREDPLPRPHRAFARG